MNRRLPPPLALPAARPWRALTLLALLALAGCAVQQVRQLDTFKTQAAAGDYAAIAAATVECDEADAACAQAHLLKGDACYRLAKGGATEHYACAADELGAGLAAVGFDQPAQARVTFTTNRCEALRQTRDQLSGAPATARNEALAACAHALETLSPGSPAARFFEVNAGLAAIQTAALAGPDTAGCGRLDALAARLKERESAAAAAGLTAPYRRLAADLQLSRRGLACR